MVERGRWVSLAALGLVLSVAYWRLWLGEALFWGLPSLQFVPWRAYGFDALRAGHLPLWNPYNGGGAPLFANYQSAFLYPLNWPGLLASSYPALGWLMSLTAVLHLFLGGVGMWLFTGRLGYPVVGRGVSMLGYALTTYTVARLGTFPTVTVAAWIPFLLWGVEGIMRGGLRRHFAPLALVVALLLTGGHAQTAWYGLLLAGGYALWRLLRDSPAAGWRRLAGAGGAVALGAGMAGLQLLATAELTLNSQRADGYGDEALRYSYSLARTIMTLAPNLFGNPGDGSYVGRGLVYEYGTYVGVITLVGAAVAMLAVFVGRRQSDHLRDVPFWTGVLVIGGVFALGINTPVYPLLYNNVPTFDTFQAPVRWHIWTVTALAVLGGAGAASWGTGRRALLWTRLVTVGAVGAVLVVLASPLLLPADIVAIADFLTVVRAVGMTAVWVGLAGVITLLKPQHMPGRFRPLPGWYSHVWPVLVVVVLAADLGWATRGLNPTVPASFYRPRPVPPDSPLSRSYWPLDALDAALFGQVLGENGEVEVLEPEQLGYTPLLYPSDYRYAQANADRYRAANLPNINLLDRAYMLNNNEPLRPAAYDDLLATLPTAERIAGRERLQPTDGPAVDEVHLSLDETVLLPAALPRVYLENGTGTVMSVIDGYNRTTVVLEDVQAGAALVLRDVDFPGWTVEVNGEPARYTARGPMARVLPGLPPGSVTVTFVYRPAWLLPGALVSGVSLLMWLGLAIVSLRPQTRQTSPTPKPT